MPLQGNYAQYDHDAAGYEKACFVGNLAAAAGSVEQWHAELGSGIGGCEHPLETDKQKYDAGQQGNYA
jgi:hypothetical protein